jgi:hypothetical protein
LWFEGDTSMSSATHYVTIKKWFIQANIHALHIQKIMYFQFSRRCAHTFHWCYICGQTSRCHQFPSCYRNHHEVSVLSYLKHVRVIISSPHFRKYTFKNLIVLFYLERRLNWKYIIFQKVIVIIGQTSKFRITTGYS